MNTDFVAHHREIDCKNQSVASHLKNTSRLCSAFAGKLALTDAGTLLGLLHDLGKYSLDFQEYIRLVTGMVPGSDAVGGNAYRRGDIDHSTAGAQWVWQRFRQYGPWGQLAGQMMALCLASHHGGMMDCLDPDGVNKFQARMKKDDAKTHMGECLEKADEIILSAVQTLADVSFLETFRETFVKTMGLEKGGSNLKTAFRAGFAARFLFSCLIDADRMDTADFENPGNRMLRLTEGTDWQPAIDRLEEKIRGFDKDTPINKIRADISGRCLERAGGSPGIYSLTIPTGGGKTLASLRFALHHAKAHNLDRILFIVPFTSIIEQNAQAVRQILEKESDGEKWVLEHHSNLDPDENSPWSKLAGENWASPIIFTTMVQFLDVLFKGGTRSVRRLHNLARSVLVFDEIQTLPIKTVHLFCNAVEFLTDHGTTAVLCTATQPLLNRLRHPEKGQLNIPDGNELAGDVEEVFRHLKRVEIKNLVQDQGWSEESLKAFVLEQYTEKGNCLVIVNTKNWARKLFEACKEDVGKDSLFHLSTHLCPAHRKEVFNTIKERLAKGDPVLCISTQLIEAGVDISFKCVIRFLAGLDAIAQAAGRCNRNGEDDTAEVFVVNPAEEKIDLLPDIKTGREEALRIFSETEEGDLLSPGTMSRYFSYYFYKRSDQMTYPLRRDQIGRDDTLLNLLSENRSNNNWTSDQLRLQQSFKTAGNFFQAIESPARAVIVPFGRGEKIIAGLCAAEDPVIAAGFLKSAQQYSVNIFANTWDALVKACAIHPVQEGEDIWYLDPQFYSLESGVSTEPVNAMEFKTI